jgi:NTP pyrophosphatase (non-canonical NTP hydrolase)
MSSETSPKAETPINHYQVNPWQPMDSKIGLKHLGKLNEELGECVAASSRCIIQGIDELEPETGKPNRQWLEEEIADVLANLDLVCKHFELDEAAIAIRANKKFKLLTIWHEQLAK